MKWDNDRMIWRQQWECGIHFTIINHSPTGLMKGSWYWDVADSKMSFQGARSSNLSHFFHGANRSPPGISFSCSMLQQARTIVASWPVKLQHQARAKGWQLLLRAGMNYIHLLFKNAVHPNLLNCFNMFQLFSVRNMWCHSTVFRTWGATFSDPVGSATGLKLSVPHQPGWGSDLIRLVRPVCGACWAHVNIAGKNGKYIMEISCIITHSNCMHVMLVVEPYPSEQYEFVNWDDDIPNWMEKLTMFQTTNQVYILLIYS